MTNYKINYTANTMTITKAFAAAAAKIDTAEYNTLARIKKDYPTMQIVNKTHRASKTSNRAKGLTYENMERYINTFANANDIIDMFEIVKERSLAQSNKYNYVKSWFVAQFPQYSNPVFNISENIVILKPFPAQKEAA